MSSFKDHRTLAQAASKQNRALHRACEFFHFCLSIFGSSLWAVRRILRQDMLSNHT